MALIITCSILIQKLCTQNTSDYVIFTYDNLIQKITENGSVFCSVKVEVQYHKVPLIIIILSIVLLPFDKSPHFKPIYA